MSESLTTKLDRETAPDAAQQESGADFLAFGVCLIRDARRILVVTGLSLVIGLLVAFLLRPDYTASAIIMPPQQQQSSASALLGSLGSLGSLASLGSGSGASSLLKNPGDMYIGILQSHTIFDRLIDRFHLRAVYRKKTLVDARKALDKHTSFESEKDGLIHISVTDHNPQRASDIANGFIDELYRMNSTLAISEASQRRLFFSQQVDQEKIALNKAEDDLAATQQKTGLIELSGQAELILRTIAQVRAQMTSDQVQLEGMLASATEENPQVQRLRQEIAALQSQLDKLQNDQSKLQPGDTEVPAGRVPQEALEYVRKLREVKYHELLFELLSKQYEAARIDEAKSAPVIQVVDRATPPDKKSGPLRSLIILGIGFAGFLIACLWSLFSDALRRKRKSPEFEARFQELRAGLRARP